MSQESQSSQCSPPFSTAPLHSGSLLSLGKVLDGFFLCPSLGEAGCQGPLSLPSCLTFNKLLDFSEPPLPLLQNGADVTRSKGFVRVSARLPSTVVV